MLTYKIYESAIKEHVRGTDMDIQTDRKNGNSFPKDRDSGDDKTKI